MIRSEMRRYLRGFFISVRVTPTRGVAHTMKNAINLI